MTDRELMQMALDALEAMQSYAAAEKKGLRICDEAIEALRARLEKWTAKDMAYPPGGLPQSEQELVAWSAQPDLAQVGEVGVWGQREWQGLTDEEIDETAWPYFIGNIMPSVKLIVRQLEAKLKEKNNE